MAEINSPLGRSQVRGGGGRHFTVDDASEGQEYQGHRRYAQQNPQQVPQTPQTPQTPQQPRGPIVFNSSEPVVPPGYNPQYSQQHQHSSQQMQDGAVHHGSYEEAMAYRKQYMEQLRAEREQQSFVDKSSLEVILGIGRKTVNVPVESELGTTVFTLCTLKSKERRVVAKAMDQFILNRTHENLHNVRDTILTYAIQAIEGKPLDAVLNCTDMPDEDRYYVREAFVKEMDDNISLYIFSKFEEMDTQARSKYSVKTQEDLKGVADAISKSGQGG